jgi:hypothetical protein
LATQPKIIIIKIIIMDNINSDYLNFVKIADLDSNYLHFKIADFIKIIISQDSAEINYFNYERQNFID